MGLPDEKLVDPRSVPAGLRCVICTEVFLDPVCEVSCQHVFCAFCIHQAINVQPQPQCPLCRVPIDERQLRRSRPIQALLDDLQVKCDHAVSGCGWTGRLEDSAAHQAMCPVPENQQLRAALGTARAELVQLQAEKQALAKEKALAERSHVASEVNLKKLLRRSLEDRQTIDRLQTQNSALLQQKSSLQEYIRSGCLVRDHKSDMQTTQIFVKDFYNKSHVMRLDLNQDMYVSQLHIAKQMDVDDRVFYLTGMGRYFQSQWKSFKLSTLPCLVPMKKVELFIPWWLENGGYLEAGRTGRGLFESNFGFSWVPVLLVIP